MLKILKRQESPLLGRTEAVLEVEFTGATPSMGEMKKKAAAQLNAKEELVDVQKIKTAFGERKAAVEVHAYKDEKAFKDYRVAPKQKVAKTPAAEKAA